MNLSSLNATAAIFDMDGTIIDNAVYHHQAWRTFVKKYGFDEPTDEDFKTKISGRTNTQIFDTIFDKSFSDAELTAYADEKETIYRELYAAHIVELAGLSPLLKLLHEHDIKTAMATSAPKANRDFGLAALKLEDMFEAIVGDEHVNDSKPHPAIYLEAARQLGVEPSKCLVFEDSPSGVAAGKNAGMTVIALLSSHSPEELSAADYQIHDYTELSW